MVEKRREHLVKQKIIAKRSPLFSPEEYSKTTAFTFLSVQLFFSSASVKKKHHHFTAQHEDRRERGGAEEEEESRDSGTI